MINIYRSTYDSKLNLFNGRQSVRPDEVIVKQKHINGEVYTYAEPSQEGVWAFGGTILFTSNGIYPDFNTPIKLHDRDMNLERDPYAKFKL